MATRLNKIYTKKGDNGTTGLGNGERVNKDHPRVLCLGEIDELNSIVGLILTENISDNIKDDLVKVQHILFNIGGEIAVPGFSLISEKETNELEEQLDQYNKELSPLIEFILPGGSKASSYTHLARSVCRRAERNIFVLNEYLKQKNEDPLVNISRYINRLSDYFFVLARYINKYSDFNDVLWQNPTRKNDTDE